VADNPSALDPKSVMMLQEAYRHHKTVGAWGAGTEALAVAGIDVNANGVVTSTKSAKAFTDAVLEALGWHRHWQR
jgi:catalase